VKAFPQLKPITLTQADAKRLEPHLVSARRLNEVLVMDSVSDQDLRRMVLAEAAKPTPRVTIIKKLLGRIYARQRKEILDLVFPNGHTNPRQAPQA
jgi:hypothetical protein